jgi:hypothetical protein
MWGWTLLSPHPRLIILKMPPLQGFTLHIISLLKILIGKKYHEMGCGLKSQLGSLKEQGLTWVSAGIPSIPSIVVICNNSWITTSRYVPRPETFQVCLSSFTSLRSPEPISPCLLVFLLQLLHNAGDEEVMGFLGFFRFLLSCTIKVQLSNYLHSNLFISVACIFSHHIGNPIFPYHAFLVNLSHYSNTVSCFVYGLSPFFLFLDRAFP